MGLVVDEIVDIVEEQLNIEVSTELPGVIGSAVVKEQATEILDIGHYFPKAFDDWFRRPETANLGYARRVLLVDDSAFFRNMLTPVLAAGGYSVTAVDSAAEALKLCSEGVEFDIIVSDIEMPEMDGFGLADTLSSNDNWSDVPIVALSSHTSPAVIERARDANFVDFVGKFDREGLMEVIKQTVETVGEAA